jgi:hypothetical protein
LIVTLNILGIGRGLFVTAFFKKGEPIMRKTAFTIVHRAKTAKEAQGVIDRLRTTGLHPAELALTAPLPFSSGSKRTFPIEVPP